MGKVEDGKEDSTHKMDLRSQEKMEEAKHEDNQGRSNGPNEQFNPTVLEIAEGLIHALESMGIEVDP